MDALGYGPISEDLEAGRVGLIWAPARAFADPPNKRDTMTRRRGARDERVDGGAHEDLGAPRRELVLTSPYLIPGPLGITAFEALGQRKVKTVVLTNSLAATDEPLVHTGYSRYRVRLLESGVDLYEISPERTRRTKRLGMFGSSFGRLHAKTAVVDQRTVFIGSMNLDPRSDTQNTELGIFVDSPQLAKELLRIINISKLQSAYRVRLDAHGNLEWLTMDDDKEMILTEEPETTFWLRRAQHADQPLRARAVAVAPSKRRRGCGWCGPAARRCARPHRAPAAPAGRWACRAAAQHFHQVGPQAAQLPAHPRGMRAATRSSPSPSTVPVGTDVGAAVVAGQAAGQRRRSARRWKRPPARAQVHAAACRWHRAAQRELVGAAQRQPAAIGLRLQQKGTPHCVAHSSPSCTARSNCAGASAHSQRPPARRATARRTAVSTPSTARAT